MTLRLFLLLPLLLPRIATAEVTWDQLPDHPRLFADAAKFAELKRTVKENDVSRDFHQILKTRAESLLDQEPAVRTLTGKRLLAVSRQSLECVMVCAMAGKLEDNTAYKKRAIDEMRALAGFPDWNPSHFLDVAEATFAMGVGYDWLHDDMTPEDRDLISTAIIEKGLKPSIPTAGKREPSWLKGTNNWNQVCHGGMVVGALAIAERDPELAKTIVNRAVDNLKYSAAAYAPDGIYPEGPGYWSYGTSFHVSLIEALRTALGGTFDLEKFPGFLKTPDFIVQMESPAGRYYNYSDNGQTVGFQTALFWFAKELKRPELLRTNVTLLEKHKAKPSNLERMMPLALIWWNPSPQAGMSSPPESWIADGKVPLAVFRQGWGDPRATFAAFKGGAPGISHGHMDVGSFIMESGKVRWAEDLGAQSYQTLESKGVDLWNSRQDSQRWQVFRLGPESHNIPRLNGQPQNVTGRATVLKSSVESRFMILDLTDLYTPAAHTLKRGLRMTTDGAVQIRDEWRSEMQPAEMTFQWLTKTTVMSSEKSVTLTSGENSLHLDIAAGTPFTIEVDDMSAPVRDYDAANPRLKRIRITTTTPPDTDGWLSVTASPASPAGGSPPPLDQW